MQREDPKWLRGEREPTNGYALLPSKLPRCLFLEFGTVNKSLGTWCARGSASTVILGTSAGGCDGTGGGGSEVYRHLLCTPRPIGALRRVLLLHRHAIGVLSAVLPLLDVLGSGDGMRREMAEEGRRRARRTWPGRGRQQIGRLGSHFLILFVGEPLECVPEILTVAVCKWPNGSCFWVLVVGDSVTRC
jgi:hypothetical protein